MLGEAEGGSTGIRGTGGGWAYPKASRQRRCFQRVHRAPGSPRSTRLSPRAPSAAAAPRAWPPTAPPGGSPEWHGAATDSETAGPAWQSRWTVPWRRDKAKRQMALQQKAALMRVPFCGLTLSLLRVAMTWVCCASSVSACIALAIATASRAWRCRGWGQRGSKAHEQAGWGKKRAGSQRKASGK